MMKIRTGAGTALCTLTLALCSLRAVIAEDIAVVVGINHYPRLILGNLHGCVNDAEAMKQALEATGFHVLPILESEATKAGILHALEQAKTKVGPQDRFVFYFAGHGCRVLGQEAVLLTADTEEGSRVYTLNKQELTQAIGAIPTSKRTVILDSCFAAGVLQPKGLDNGFQLRFHPMAQAKSLTNEGETDTQDYLIDKAFCGFAACTSTQQSGEMPLEGKQHGVFTYFLLKELKNYRKQEPWESLYRRVAADVTAKTSLQTPVFGPESYLKAPVFSSLAKGSDTAPAASLWDYYAVNRTDTESLRLRVLPNIRHIRANEPFSIQAQIGREGYLVLLNRDASDRITLFSPRLKPGTLTSALAEGAKKSSKSQVTIAASGTDQGTERLKAILFHDRADFEWLVEQFRRAPSGGLTSEQLYTKSLSLKSNPKLKNSSKTDGAWSYFTAMAEVEILSQTDSSDAPPTNLTAPQCDGTSPFLRRDRP